MDKIKYSWATSGYLGAISSGQTTCGLLIGATVAIGLRHGQGKTCIPFEDEEERGKAVKEVNDFYRDFLTKFKDTNCQTLTTIDFSKPEDQARYMEKEIFKDTCFKFFQFLMTRFMDEAKQREAEEKSPEA